MYILTSNLFILIFSIDFQSLLFNKMSGVRMRMYCFENWFTFCNVVLCLPYTVVEHEIEEITTERS